MNGPGPLFITRKISFSAAHRLYNPAWSDERNEAVFGACARPGGHGHDYVLEVTLRGVPDPETGMVVDLKRVKEIVRERFWAAVDHRDLNADVPFLAGKVPTAEHLAVAAWELLAPAFAGALFRIRLHETEKNIVDYYGPEIPRDPGERSRP